MRKAIIFLSDFGLDDVYVGVVKGVIANINPKANVIDLLHTIPLGDIQQAAFVLWQAFQYFPPKAVFLCVVDPGVGSERYPIIIACGKQFFVGPNNGIFSYVIHGRAYRSWKITNHSIIQKNLSNTFHGRDVFAPAAAHITKGVSLERFGEELHQVVTIPFPLFYVHKEGFSGEALFNDHFGNIITSIGRFIPIDDDKWEFNAWTDYSSSGKIVINPYKMKIHIPHLQINPLIIVKTFEDIPIGNCAAIIGSSGMIEIIANQASAENILNIKKHDTIKLIYNENEKEGTI